MTKKNEFENLEIPKIGKIWVFLEKTKFFHFISSHNTIFNFTNVFRD